MRFEKTKLLAYFNKDKETRFNYIEPKTIEEAASLIIKYQGKGRVIAGGTDLLIQIRDKGPRPEYLVDITGIPGLEYIKYDAKQGLFIGALMPIRALELSGDLRQIYPVISQAAGLLGSVAIRNVATVGGNLCNAAPSAEMAPALIGLSARGKILGMDGGHRVLPLEDFFVGPGTTVLQTGELLVEIQVPVPEPHTKGVYFKHSLRGTVDLAMVGVAAVLTLEAKSARCRDIKIVLGAVAPKPMRARKAEEVLRGNKIDEGLINQCAEVASQEASPISDVRASAEYRKEMVKVFTRRAIREALAK